MSVITGPINYHVENDSNQYYAFTSDAINDFLLEVATKDDWNTLYKTLDPSQCVLGVFCYPFKMNDIAILELVSGEHGFYISGTEFDAPGPGELSPYLAYKMTGPVGTLYGGYVDVPELEDFRDYAPYSTYELYIPFYGTVQLDADKVVGKRIRLEYVPNFNTGTGTAYLTVIESDSSEWLYMSLNVKLGINIPFTTTNNLELQRQALEHTNNQIMNGIGVALGVVGAVAGIASGGGIGAGIASGAGAIAGIANMAVNESNYQLEHVHRYTTNNLTDASTALWSPLYMQLRIYRSKLIIPTNYDSLNGRPLFENRTLKNVTGYTEVASVHLDGIGGATADELNEIESLLKSGVIL